MMLHHHHYLLQRVLANHLPASTPRPPTGPVRAHEHTIMQALCRNYELSHRVATWAGSPITREAMRGVEGGPAFEGGGGSPGGRSRRHHRTPAYLCPLQRAYL